MNLLCRTPFRENYKKNLTIILHKLFQRIKRKIPQQILFYFKIFYSFIFRERGMRGKNRKRSISAREGIDWLPLLGAPDWGLNPQFRPVPSLGYQPATFYIVGQCFAGQCPTNWATLVRDMTHLKRLGELWQHN